MNNRTIEIRVRMAVGAQRWQVIWMVLRDSLLLTAVGTVVGLPLALPVGKTSAPAPYWVEALRRA